MASWGLAFEYGKNAYTDMLKKQEELDRYLAERDLWRARLTEEEEAQAMNTYVNRDVRNGLASLTRNKSAVVNLDDDAFVQTLNEVSAKSGVRYEKQGNKVYRVANGSKTEAYDLKSDELKNGASRVAIIQNMIDPSSAIRDKHTAEVKSNREMQLEYDKLTNARNVAQIGANAKIRAAGLTALTKTSSTTGEGKDKKVKWSKEDVATASTYAVPLVFGAGASGARDENGMWVVTNADGTPRTVTQEDAHKLETALNAMKTQTENASRDTKAEPSVVMTGVYNDLADRRASVKKYNDDLDTFKKDSAEWSKEKAARDAIIARNDAKYSAVASLEDRGLAYIADNIVYEAVPELRPQPVFSDIKNNPGLAYKKDWLTP